MTTAWTAGRKVELSANGRILRTINGSEPKRPPELSLVGAPKKEFVSPWELEASETAAHYGEFDRPLLSDWKNVVKKAKVNGIKEANNRMKMLRRLFKIGDFVVHNLDDKHIQDYSEIKARVCIKTLRGWEKMPLEAAAAIALPIAEHHQFDETEKLKEFISANKLLEMLEKMAFAAGGVEDEIDMHAIEKANEKIVTNTPKIIGFLKRLQDQDWWRRRIRRMQNQRIEKISRELHQVVITRSAYCSEIGKREWKRRQGINMDMLEHTLMENDEGDQYTLADLSETSVANPAVRRTELMVRIAGLEEHAKELGYEGYMFTVTCPSKYHAATRKTGAKNPKFKGASPRDAQKYLCSLWARFRSLAKRVTKKKLEEWEFFGFRVAEPHHDGTPHWHLLVFINPHHVEDVKKALRWYASQEDNHELTTEKRRNARFHYTKIKTGINPKTGNEYSAAGYIAKYIAKNIDGEYVDVDLYGQDAKTAAKAITAWASRNGIRQFQQVGGPSVTVWRELRRLARLPEDMWNDEDQPLREFVMQLEAEAQQSASHAWAIYCNYYGENGLSLEKVMRTICRTITHIDEETGQEYSEELHRPTTNAYGEPGEKINGVIHGKIIVCSRWRNWQRVDATREQAAAVREQRKAERLERIEVRAQARAAAHAAEVGALAPPWTGVNNCTGWPEGQKIQIPTPQLELTF